MRAPESSAVVLPGDLVRPLDLGAQALNIRQFGDFRDYWRASPDYPPQNFGNIRYSLPVEVRYEHPTGAQPVRFKTEMNAFVGSGPDDGMIDLEDTDRISIESYHLRYLPAFQTYRYNEDDKALVVTGISKFGKPYQVTIRPTLREP